MDDACALGFDHIALCAGAGRPTVHRHEERPGARRAHRPRDFLMALQLTGAAKTTSIANLQVRLPVVVIGGGLTAIDTATEIARLLLRAGGEVPARATRRWSPSAARPRCAPRWTDEETRDRRRVPGPRARASAPSATRAAPRAAPPRSSSCCDALGRRHHRLSPPADRRPSLHAQPRGSREGAGGRHPLRRGPDAGGGRGRRFGHAAGAARVGAAHDGDGDGERDPRCRRARSWSPPARSPTRCWRARTPRTSSSTASISRPSTRPATR